MSPPNISITATSADTTIFIETFPSTPLSRRARDSLLLHRGYTAPVLSRDINADSDMEGEGATPLARRFRDSLDVARPIYQAEKARRKEKRGLKGWVRGAWYGMLIRGD
jgi:hypothetical protein